MTGGYCQCKKALILRSTKVSGAVRQKQTEYCQDDAAGGTNAQATWQQRYSKVRDTRSMVKADVRTHHRQPAAMCFVTVVRVQLAQCTSFHRMWSFSLRCYGRPETLTDDHRQSPHGLEPTRSHICLVTTNRCTKGYFTFDNHAPPPLHSRFNVLHTYRGYSCFAISARGLYRRHSDQPVESRSTSSNPAEEYSCTHKGHPAVLGFMTSSDTPRQRTVMQQKCAPLQQSGAADSTAGMQISQL